MFLILSYLYHLGGGMELPHLLPLMEAVVDDLADGDGVVRVPPEGAVTAGGGAVVHQSGIYGQLSSTQVMFSSLRSLQKIMGVMDLQYEIHVNNKRLHSQ